jgi:hypothetical protein
VAPARMKAKAVFWFTPPAAINGTSGNIAFSAGRCQRTRKNDYVLLRREFHDVEINSIAGQEFDSGLQAETCRVHIEYASSSYTPSFSGSGNCEDLPSTASEGAD